jgi:hypothetical protein
MSTPDPPHTAPSSPQPPSKPKALIVISSARTLPLAQPSGHPGISTGFFLVEMAKVLQAFGDDYDLVFATPDGRPPQLDINGMALSFHAVPGLGPATARAAAAQATRFDADTFRQRRPQLLARRDAELATAYQLLGRLPVSQPLPNTDKEAKLVRDDLVTAFAALPEHPYHSARELVERNRDPQDPLKATARSPPPATTTSPAPGRPPCPSTRNLFALTTAYPKVPGHKTRLTYYVDEALKDAGYQVETAINPVAVRVVYDEKANLLTGNGPQAIDDQAAKLRELLDGATQRGRPATTRTPA